MKNNKFSSKLHIKLYLQLLVLLILLPMMVLKAQFPTLPDKWSDAYAYTNGIRMHYYHAKPSSGKPVIVMVHGYTDIGLSWATLTLKLQDAYDIYMVDTRGHGFTDPFTASDNGETMIKDVVGFVQAMNFEKPILMGHSMGAATVMRIGAEYSDLAKAIIMLDPSVGRRLPMPPTTPSTGKATAIPARRPGLIKSPNSLVLENNTPLDQVIAAGHRGNPLWSDLDIYYWAFSKKQYHGPYTPEQANAMMGTMSSTDALSKIKVPVLILKADASPEVRKANEEAARVIQHGKLVYIDGAAHNLHHDKLAKTVEVLNEFLKTL